jgi:hypothetical protein
LQQASKNSQDLSANNTTAPTTTKTTNPSSGSASG